MVLPWTNIHELEVTEDYPAAVNALEERLIENPSDAEVVIRLGFNLWYAVVENDRMRKNLPVEAYAHRFMELLQKYRDALIHNADFCWVFGQGIEMFWYYFPGTTKELGTSLISRACELDPFWAGFWTARDEVEATKRFRGRGVFQSYYAIK